jgi:GR25 family glycosyltransferase involved in LPS biosynthesis
MKIAIFNGFNFHFEMFGYIIDYCLKRNIQLDIYTQIELDLGWLSFYKNKIIKDSKDIAIIKASFYPSNNNYDHIILTTDDDRFFPDMLINEKFICIDHYHKIRRFTVPYHITTRNFHSRKICDWALPVYKLTDVTEKNEKSKKQIICIGRFCPTNIKNFSKLFGDQFESITFYFIDRHIEENKHRYQGYSNISCMNELDTELLVKLLISSDYVFITKENKDHIDVSMSAAIPLAFNCLCQIIMPKEMKENYGFKSVLAYEDNSEIKLEKPNFNLINEELEELIEHKMTVFDKYLIQQKDYNFVPYMIVYKNSELRLHNFLKIKESIENLQMFEAIDTINNYSLFEGKSLEEKLFSPKYLSYCRKLKGKLGCSMSHIYLWNQFFKSSKQDWLLVLEDDLGLNNYNYTLLNKLIEVANENKSNYIHLFTSKKFYPDQTKQEEITKINNGDSVYTLYKMIPQWYGIAYMINKKGIEFMLSKLPYDDNNDSIISKYCKELNALSLVNDIVINKGALDAYDKNSEFGSLLWNYEGIKKLA